MHYKDETGNKYGLLTVLHKDESKISNYAHWVCRCDCGNITSVAGSNLRAGTTKSCGCLAKEARKHKLIDLTGKRFGRLTVLYRAENKNGRVYWHCKCDCGNEKDILGSSLRSGATKSCGCFAKDRSSETHLKDISGQQFGFLVPLYIIPTKDKRTFWHCKCLNCGGEVNVTYHSLVTGDTKSCGCLRKSYGEAKITQLLIDNNVNFIAEYSFDDCRSKQNIKLRFDFAVFKNNKLYCLIEYQGEQHTQPVKRFGGEKNFKIVQERDNIKREYCKIHNIPLIEIPYTDKNKITWNYLKEKCNL